MRATIKYLAVICIIFVSAKSYSQNPSDVNNLVSAIDSFAVRMPAEKVYLHIDKPYYTNTDTIWLKAYVLNNALEGSGQSGILYTELVNDTGRVVLRQALPVLLGISWSQIPLDSVIVPEGSYTLRAYTNWMQNFGGESFFTRQLYISKADEAAWLVKAGSKTAVKEGKNNTEVALQLLGQDGDPVRLRDMQLKLMEGGKTWLREKMQTDIDGKIAINFNVPPKADTRLLTLIAQDTDKGSNGKKLAIPLHYAREENIDLQFMPEGGNLVAGLTTRVAFKAINEDGKGVDIAGTVFNSTGAEVATFTSGFKGMGLFELTPIAGETYTAKLTSPKGATKTYTLPLVKPSGIVLTVNNIPARDSLIVAVQATPDAIPATGSYSLIAQSVGTVCYASAITFKDGKSILNGRVAKSKFPAGVARFTLFDGNKQPLAGRIIFIDHHDALNININTGKQSYQSNDSVTLAIQVADKDNKPVQGSFSLAVTDDSTVKADSTNICGVNSYMLLQSELKGSIEEPGYYFANNNAETALALDNLLLTQGWIAYEWKDMFNPPSAPKFRAEKEIAVTGTVIRLKKPQPGIPVTLLSTNKPVIFRDTVSDSNGHFSFTDLPRVDTPSYMVKIRDKKGKVFEAVIQADEFEPAGTKGLIIPHLNPWYVNSDTTLLHNNAQNIAMQKQLQAIRFPQGTQLKEVVIKGIKIIKGSKNLNGSGVADQVLGEEDMQKAGKLTLFDMINQRMIMGLGVDLFPVNYTGMAKVALTKHNYALAQKKVHFIIDGVNIHNFFQPMSGGEPTKYEEFEYVNAYLRTITAEDVRGIEVLNNSRYSRKYYLPYLQGSDFNRTLLSAGDKEFMEYAFIEITTWSGNGAFMKRVNGRYLYRPLPVIWPKEFYKPKYIAKPNTIFDLRSTIHWAPDIITDTAGRASVTFNTKSKKGTYTVILQGSNVNGAVGSIRKKIVVKNP